MITPLVCISTFKIPRNLNAVSQSAFCVSGWDVSCKVASSKEINCVITDSRARKVLSIYPGGVTAYVHRKIVQKESVSFICNNPILSKGD